MKNLDETIEVDVSRQMGYYSANVSDQVSGKWFPDSKVKPGTRWFYILILIVFLCSVISQLVNAIMIVCELLSAS